MQNKIQEMERQYADVLDSPVGEQFADPKEFERQRAALAPKSSEEMERLTQDVIELPSPPIERSYAAHSDVNNPEFYRSFKEGTDELARFLYQIDVGGVERESEVANYMRDLYTSLDRGLLNNATVRGIAMTLATSLEEGVNAVVILGNNIVYPWNADKETYEEIRRKGKNPARNGTKLVIVQEELDTDSYYFRGLSSPSYYTKSIGKISIKTPENPEQITTLQ